MRIFAYFQQFWQIPNVQKAKMQFNTNAKKH